MTANVILDKFPPVVRLRFLQGSTVEAGRLIVDTLVVGPDEITKLPRFTSLTLYGRNFTGTWNKLRVVKVRVRHGRMRVVLKDSRWLLEDKTLGNNYNSRTSLGTVMTGTEKSIPDLLDEIGMLTGITFTAGDLPPYLPPARWAGKNAATALKELLHNTGCRMVYDPQTTHYNISLAGTGFYPELSDRAFRPGPPPNISEVEVRSAPTLYEDELDATAKQINVSTGETESLAATNLATTPNATHAQTRFRLWEPDSIAHPEALGLDKVLLNDHRAKSHLPDPGEPVHEKARLIPDSWDMYPHHQPLYTPDSDVTNMVKLTGGGRVFITDHPVLMRTGNSFAKTAKVLTSYYVIEEDGTLRRASKTQVVDGESEDKLTLDMDWIKTVDSTESDMSGPVWDDLHQQVLEAVAGKYDPNSGEGPQTVHLTNPIALQGSGQVGGVDYYYNSDQHRPRMDFYVALNFNPGSQGAIR